MIAAERIRKALHSSQPASALRTLVNELFSEGHEKADIIGELERFIVQERERIAGLASTCLCATRDVQEANEEIMFDVLDALHGSCQRLP